MIPRVSQQGVSFKGAGLYYLHDKQANTNDRVGFTETLNLPTNDPEKAMKVMAWVASHQRDIREASVLRDAQRAGASYEEYVREHNPFRGRPMQKTVYAYSLSWHPSEDITPEQMACAAKETLAVLGLEKHQAVLVQHTDEPHPHIHVIANKVNPETGLGPKRWNEKAGRYEDALKNDHIKLSIWAEQHERKTGRILCWNRVENNARRFPKDGSPGEYVKYKGEHASRPDYDWWKENEHRPADQIRSQRLLDQAAERSLLHMRETKARATLERKLDKDCKPAFKKLDEQINVAESRLKADKSKPSLRGGLFNFTKAKIRQSVRKILGAHRRDEHIIKDLRRAKEAVQEEQAQRREHFDATVAKRWQKLKDKQSAERERDEKRITLRESERRCNKLGTTEKRDNSLSRQPKLVPEEAAKLKAPNKKLRQRTRNRDRRRIRTRNPG